MAKKTKEEKKQDLAKALRQLAEDTRAWMLNIGACTQDGNVQGYITIEDWCDSFKDIPEMWYVVKVEMLRLDYRLAVNPTSGHYIGEAGEQASSAALQAKNLAKRADTFKALLRRMKDSKDWPLIEKELRKALPYGRTINDFLSLSATVGSPQMELFTLLESPED